MFKRRAIVLAGLFLLLFSVALARLGQLQLVESAAHRQRRDLRLRKDVDLTPRRGAILDRNGLVLAEDRPSFDLYLDPVVWTREKRRYVGRSLLAPLDFQRLVALASRTGETRAVEMRLAAAELAGGALAQRLADLAGITPTEAAAILLDRLPVIRPGQRPEDGAIAWRHRKPVAVGIDFDAWIGLRAERALDGAADDALALDPRVGRTRVYPRGATAAHLLGYVNELSPEEYEQLRGRWKTVEERLADGGPTDADDPEASLALPGKGVVANADGHVLIALAGDDGGPSDEEQMLRLRPSRRRGRLVRVPTFLPDDRVGRDGLEEYYNQRLRGRHVRMRMERRLGQGYVPLDDRTVAVDGADLRLTFEATFQEEVERILADAVQTLGQQPEFRVLERPLTGAAVVMDCHNGRLLALASVPGFDPGQRRQRYDEWLADPAKPLANRAVRERYAPGSVIKPLTTLAALLDHAIDIDFHYECPGYFLVGRRKVHCINRNGHGTLTMVEALEVSCNPYFQGCADRLGGTALAARLHDFGLGRRTGIDLPREEAGQLPYAPGRSVPLPEAYNIAIGQGPISTTPLQIAVAFAAMANAENGAAHRVTPHLAADPELDRARASFPVEMRALEEVRQGMWQVVQGRRGSGRTADLRRYDPRYEIAGKTGSAEIGFRHPLTGKRLSHAWMAAYAPFDKPEVVVVVVVPLGDRGGATCAPILRDILRAYYQLPALPAAEAWG